MAIDTEALALNSARLEYLAIRVADLESELEELFKQQGLAYAEREEILGGGRVSS